MKKKLVLIVITAFLVGCPGELQIDEETGEKIIVLNEPNTYNANSLRGQLWNKHKHLQKVDESNICDIDTDFLELGITFNYGIPSEPSTAWLDKSVPELFFVGDGWVALEFPANYPRHHNSYVKLSLYMDPSVQDFEGLKWEKSRKMKFLEQLLDGYVGLPNLSFDPHHQRR